MSETSIVATGSRASVAIGDESQWGTPVRPNYSVAFTGESLANEETALESDQIRKDRGMHILKKGNEDISGDLNFEFAAGGLGKVFKHALGEYIRLDNVDGGLHGRMELSEVQKVDRGSTSDNFLMIPFTKDSNVDGFKTNEGQFINVSKSISGGRTNDQLQGGGDYGYNKFGPDQRTYLTSVTYDSFDPLNTSNNAVRITVSDVFDEDGNQVTPDFNRQAGLLECGHDRTQLNYFGGQVGETFTADVASTAEISGTGVTSIDGQTVGSNDDLIVLLKDQSTADDENGLWNTNGSNGDATDTSNWVRYSEYNSVSEINKGNIVDVRKGSTNGGSTFVQSNVVSSSITSSIDGASSDDSIAFESYNKNQVYIDDGDIVKTSLSGDTVDNVDGDTVTVSTSGTTDFCNDDIIRVTNNDTNSVTTLDNDDSNVYEVVSVDHSANTFKMEPITGSNSFAQGDGIDYDILQKVGEVDEQVYFHPSLSVIEDEAGSSDKGWASGGAPYTLPGDITLNQTKGNWIYQYDASWNDVYTYHFERARYVPTGLTVEVHRDAAAFVYTGCKVSSLNLTYDTNSYVTGTASLIGRSESAMANLALDAAPGDSYIYVENADAIVDPTVSNTPSTTEVGIEERIGIEYISKTLVSDMSNNTDTGVEKIKKDSALDENSIYALELASSGTDLDRFHPKGSNVDPLSTTAQIDTNTGQPLVDNNNNVPFTSFESFVYFDGYWEEVQSADVTLENNPNDGKFGLGSRYKLGIPLEQAAISGSLTVEFDDGKHVHKFNKGEKFAIEMSAIEQSEDAVIRNDTCGSTGVLPQSYIFLPKCKLDGDTPNADDESYIQHDLPFTAAVDDEYNTTDMVAIIVNNYGDDVETSPDSFSP